MNLDPEDERILGLSPANLQMDLEQRGLNADQVAAEMEAALVMATLRIIEPSTRSAGPILIVDEDNNDIAEFYHREHATVGNSYEAALGYAERFVEASAFTSMEGRGK